MDRGAWWATVHGVTKSWTWLKQLSNTNRVTDKICMQTLSTIKLFLKIASKAHSTGVQRGITTISFMGIKTSLSMHRRCYYEWGRHCPILVAQVREVGTEVRSGSSQGSHFLQQQLQHWDSPLLLARRTRACLPRQGHGFHPRSRKTPHAACLGPRATTTEPKYPRAHALQLRTPVCREPTRCNKRSKERKEI